MPSWTVVLHTQVLRAQRRLPLYVRDALLALAQDLEARGPVRGDWPNYGKLGRTRHHCHLHKGRPTYVAVWEADPRTRMIEVTYVGTHQNAPY
jgi:hypothetical protein